MSQPYNQLKSIQKNLDAKTKDLGMKHSFFATSDSVMKKKPAENNLKRGKTLRDEEDKKSNQFTHSRNTVGHIESKPVKKEFSSYSQMMSKHGLQGLKFSKESMTYRAKIEKSKQVKTHQPKPKQVFLSPEKLTNHPEKRKNTSYFNLRSSFFKSFKSNTEQIEVSNRKIRKDPIQDPKLKI